jgi:phosphoribosylformylglycinamidine synthase
MRARVLVRPKEGILDPQGQVVERALPALGFEGVSRVHVGRLIELDVDHPEQLPEMCERLLANPLIEDYEIVEGVAPATSGQAMPEAEQHHQNAGPEAPRRTPL